MAKAKTPKPEPNPGVGGTYLFDVETGELKLLSETDPSGDVTNGREDLPETDGTR
jgi:hypothetical protein